MICVITRFHLRYFWQLGPMYFAYRKMVVHLKVAPGLIRYAFLIEHPSICYTLSVWETQHALETFSNVANHINAVRQAKRICREIWSTYWEFDAVSAYAQSWSGNVAWPPLAVHPLYSHRLAQFPTLEEK